MKFLIIKTSALGDIVHTFPAVQLIRNIIPDAVIDWVVEKHCAELVQANPVVNKTLLVETKKWRKAPLVNWKEIRAAAKDVRTESYDIVFDFQGNVKSGIIMGLARGKKKVGFGKKTVAEWPNLMFSNIKIDPKQGMNIREDYLALVEGVLGKKEMTEKAPAIEPRHDILVCPGSNWENKRLSERTLVEFLKKIESDKPCKFWIAQSNEKELAFAMRLKGQLKDAEALPLLSLTELQHRMQTMSLVIAMDSLPLHLAAEAGVPTFSVFGPSLAAKYRPLGKEHVSVQGACPYGQVFTKRCPLLRTCKTGACMKNLTAEKLFDCLKAGTGKGCV